MTTNIPIEYGATVFAIGTFFLLIKEILKYNRKKDEEACKERDNLFSQYVKMAASFKQATDRFDTTINNHLRHEESAHNEQSKSNKQLCEAVTKLIQCLDNKRPNE